VPNKVKNCPAVPFDVSNVLASLNKLKPTFSVGPDGHCAYFIKKLKNVLCIPLASIFEVSYRTSKIPDFWSQANVVPVFKKNNPYYVENYRPISLCCVTCKVMESLKNHVLNKHLGENKLLSDKQHGFSKGKSCQTQLLNCKTTWSKMLKSIHN